MIIIRPVDVPVDTLIADGAVLTGSNVPENDYPAFNAGTTYAAGNRVIVLAPGIHKIYESLSGGNTGNYPPTSPAQWVDLGFVNRWRMFDGGTSTLTTNDESIEIELHSEDLINSLALFNVDGSSVELECYAGTPEELVYSATVDNSILGAASNWWSYFFSVTGNEDPTRDFVFLQIPSFFSMRMVLRINRPGGVAGCGLVKFGRQQKLGTSLYGTSVSIRDYSRKDVDDFGNFTVTERRFAKLVDFDIIVDTDEISIVQKALASRRATPTVFIGTEEADATREQRTHEETIIYGYYRDFSIILQDTEKSTCTIDIEGL